MIWLPVAISPIALGKIEWIALAVAVKLVGSRALLYSRLARSVKF